MSSILGGLDETMTYDRYSKDYNIKTLKPIIDKLEFDI